MFEKMTRAVVAFTMSLVIVAACRADDTRNIAKQNHGKASAKVVFPDVVDLLRVDRNTRLPADARRNSLIALGTQTHQVDGSRYVILTDHTDDEYVESLERLAQHRSGLILRVDDLSVLYRNASDMDRIGRRLQAERVRFLAIAPRMETYRENMLLGMWELISTIDSDPQLDAFPGILLASDAEKFAALVDRSIKHVPQTAEEFQPFAICLVPGGRQPRSTIRTGFLRNFFAKHGHTTPIISITNPVSVDAPDLPGPQVWDYSIEKRGTFLKQIPANAARDFQSASLLVMHGHGIPGMSCGVDVAALDSPFSAKVVLAGSCFSASPKFSDLMKMSTAPGGYRVESRDAFSLRVIDNGATVSFGHMRLSNGFQHLFPVLETLMKGKSVGEAYQELMNGLIDLNGFQPGDFVVPDQYLDQRKPKQNSLMYVVFGDPAIQPFQRLIP